MIATLTFLAALSGGTAIAPGTYNYSATLNGQPVGSSTIVVKAGGGAPTEIDEQSTGSMNGQSATAKVSMTLGADLAPTSYLGDYDVAGEKTNVNVALTPTTASMGAQSFALTSDTKHFVVLEPGLMAGIFALPGQVRAWNGGGATAVIPVLGVSTPILPDNTLLGSRPARVPASDAGISFSAAESFTIWYDPTTFVPDEIDMPARNISILRVR